MITVTLLGMNSMQEGKEMTVRKLVFCKILNAIDKVNTTHS